MAPALARDPGTMKIPNTQLEPLAWSAVDGWALDDHAAAFSTFLASCRSITRSADHRSHLRKSKKKVAGDSRPVYGALVEICRRALALKSADAKAARAFFEAEFRPWKISTLGEAEGFVTGYYEPIVEGSRTQSEEYSVPIYRSPKALTSTVTWKRGKRPKKGKTAHKLTRGKTFYDRAQIEDGALAGRHLEICWLKDPIDAFFTHIQGSTRVLLDDGSMLRLNYDSTNGHPYYAVGRSLIDRGIVPKEEMTMERIRQYMLAHPDDGKALRRMNKSYVFFRETELKDHEEAIGAQGIPLTAGRSIAVDKKLHVYGTPFFISADLPIDSDKPETKFRRLMIAQDTGGAITGPARADIYFGAGKAQEIIAGRLRHPARFVMLIPKALDPVTAGKKIPLPRPKPPLTEKKPEKVVGASAKAVVPRAKAQTPAAAKNPVRKPPEKRK
jgi:membrane-bound lytic murein transglycosylase A